MMPLWFWGLWQLIGLGLMVFGVVAVVMAICEGRKSMNRQEFEKICRTSGYANKRQIEAYCKGRDQFSREDFAEIMRFSAKKEFCGGNKWNWIQGVKTTKHYGVDGPDNR